MSAADRNLWNKVKLVNCFFFYEQFYFIVQIYIMWTFVGPDEVDVSFLMLPSLCEVRT